MSENPTIKLMKSRFQSLFPDCFETIRISNSESIPVFNGTIDVYIGGGYKLKIIGEGTLWPRYKNIFYNEDNSAGLEFDSTNYEDVFDTAISVIDAKIIALTSLKIAIESKNSKIKKMLDHFIEKWYEQFSSDLVSFQELTEIKLGNTRIPIIENEDGSLSSTLIEKFLSRHSGSEKNLLVINRRYDQNGNRMVSLSKGKNF
jgi:hypothetical protein